MVLVPRLSCTGFCLVQAFANQSSCFFGGHQHLDGHAHGPRFRRSTTWHSKTMTKHPMAIRIFQLLFEWMWKCGNLELSNKSRRRHSIEKDTLLDKTGGCCFTPCCYLQKSKNHASNRAIEGPLHGPKLREMIINPSHQQTLLQWQLPWRCSGQQFLQRPKGACSLWRTRRAPAKSPEGQVISASDHGK